MKNIRLVTTPALDKLWQQELLFVPMIKRLAKTAAELGAKIVYPGRDAGMIAAIDAEGALGSPADESEGEYIVGAPCWLSRLTMEYILEGGEVSDLPAGSAVFVTDLEALGAAEEMLRRQVIRGLARKGVRVVGEASVFVSDECEVEAGAVLLPGTIIRGSSVVRAGAVVGPNALVEDSEICGGAAINASQVYSSSVGEGTSVGPFCYIRPGCKIGKNCRVGDFVELKNAIVDDGAKVSHLAYIGDAEVGKRVNFSCGAITSNYDGVDKHRTVIEDDAFIGCNTNLVAPVRVGAGAYTAAGTTVTGDVPAEALAIGRSYMTIKEGWAKKVQLKKAEKEARRGQK